MIGHTKWRRPSRVTGVVTIALCGVFLAATYAFLQWSPEHLPAMADDLGEVWMERAARCEGAGALDEARAHYMRALDGHFHGPQNRTHCEKRLGVVLYKLERYEEALPHLMAAQNAPDRSLNGFAPLVDTLMALERWDDAKDAARDWHEMANAEDADPALWPFWALARIAMEKGETDGARHWLNATEAWAPTHPEQPRVAQAYADLGDLEIARERLSAYLRAAPPDAKTHEYWALLARWSL